MGSYEGRGYAAGNYVDPTDSGSKQIMQFKDQFYRQMYPGNSAMWMQGQIDTRFKAGDQSLWSMIYGDQYYYQNRRYFFNLIRRHHSMIEGYQRKNRKSTVTMPLVDGDQLADEYNACLKWSEERDGFQEYFSQAFGGGLTTGISLLHLYPDYTLDPISGDLFTDNVSYNNFLIDSNFKKQDLTDCQAIWRRRWVTKEVAIALLPGHEAEINKLRSPGTTDGKFPLQAELINLDISNLLPMDEFHYRTTREATMIIDPVSGEAIEWEEETEQSEDELKQVLRMQPWLIVKKKQIPTIKLNIAVNNKTLYDGPNLLNIDRYPFVPLLCYHEPDMQSYSWKIQGIVRNLRDAQYLYNSRVVIMEDILRSQMNSGWIYPVDVVTDPKAFRQSGQGFLVPLKAGHLPNEIQRIDPPAIPASMIELAKILEEDITKISGVNEELLGSATDDKAGVLSMLRQSAGLVTLQSILDKADYSQRLYGKIRLEAIRKNFSKGKVRSILGRDPSPRFFSSVSQKYSIAVEQGNYSTTQRQMELQQLLYFKELGMPIANKSIMDAAFITNKKQVLEDMQQEVQQQQQMQQAQMQSQEKAQQADMMLKFAKAKSDSALAEERIASAQEKISKVSENAAASEQKSMAADLDLVRMMMSLEELDLNQVQRAFELAQAIKNANNPLQQEQPEVSNGTRI